MSAQVVLATRNAHKVAEVQRIVDLLTDQVEVLALSDFPGAPDVIEDGSTFAANAVKKARSVANFTGLPAIADDSGICVDALNGMPGIFSARWAGAHGADRANLELLLAQLADVPEERRGAHFLAAIALVLPTGEERVVEGIVDGQIVHAPRGEDGFGYDPIFLPYGYSRTMAELTPDQKDAISHRGQALRNMVPLLLDALGCAPEGCSGCSDCSCGKA